VSVAGPRVNWRRPTGTYVGRCLPISLDFGEGKVSYPVQGSVLEVVDYKNQGMSLDLDVTIYIGDATCLPSNADVLSKLVHFFSTLALADLHFRLLCCSCSARVQNFTHCVGAMLLGWFNATRLAAKIHLFGCLPPVRNDDCAGNTTRFTFFHPHFRTVYFRHLLRGAST
jgi:hypothetical protein